MYTVIDLETTICPSADWQAGKSLLRDGSPSPYLSENDIVTIHVLPEGGVLHTFKASDPKTKEQVQELLDKTSVLVAHNLKFDLAWLREAGFKYDKDCYCTMVTEYILGGGQTIAPSLNDTAAERGLDLKKDAVKKYWEEGINTDQIPFDVLKEYGEHDVKLAAGIYLQQIEEIEQQGLTKVVQLGNEFCSVLTDMERAGIPIDIKALDELDSKTKDRIEEIEVELQMIIRDVMGDTPINLKSPEQLSKLLYSREVKDKKEWAIEWGFYANQNKFERASMLRRIKEQRFKQGVLHKTRVIKRTTKELCSTCKGHGKVFKAGKGKRRYNCPTCSKEGIVYREGNTIAGLRITPDKTLLANAGFSGSNDAIEYILSKKKVSHIAKKFLELFNEYRKLNSYMATNIEGIRKGLVGNILHANFNQTITATARLSSSNPNVQNFPRGSTFPIKKVFTSRWEGGKIIDADFGQLEFRCAAHQAKDMKAVQDILDGVDIHAVSAEAIGCSRQDAKAHTFAPLYGSSSDWGLMDRYPNIGKWHQQLITEAVKTNQITLETGRIYKFPNVKRTATGCTHQTKIKNFGVQGFASADIVPSVIIELFRHLKCYKSYICSTIHDSVLVDVHPDEIDEVVEIVKRVMNSGEDIMRNRFDVDLLVPLPVDVSIGDNALEVLEV